MSNWELKHFGIDIASPEEYRRRSVVELTNDMTLKDVFEKNPRPGSVFDPVMSGPATESTLLQKCGHIELANPILRPECAEQMREFLLEHIGTNKRFNAYFDVTKKGKASYKDESSFRFMMAQMGNDIYKILLNLDQLEKGKRHLLILGNQTIQHNVKGTYAEMMLSVLPVPSIFARSIEDQTVGMSEKINLIISVNNDIKAYQKRPKEERHNVDLYLLQLNLVYHVTTYLDNTIPNTPSWERNNGDSFYGVGQVIGIALNSFQNQPKSIGFEIAGTSIQRMVRNINSGERFMNAFSGDCENLWFELSKQCALGKIWSNLSSEVGVYYIDGNGITFKIEMEEIHGLAISPWTGDKNLPEEVILSARKSTAVELPVHPLLKSRMAKIRDLDWSRAENITIHSKMVANFLFHEIKPQEDSISVDKVVVVNGVPDLLLCSTELLQSKDVIAPNTAFLFHTDFPANSFEQYGRFEYKETPDAYRNVIIALAELRSRGAFSEKIKFFDSRKPKEILELAVLMKHISRDQITRLLASTLVEKSSFDQTYIRDWVKEICLARGLQTDHLYPSERREPRSLEAFDFFKEEVIPQMEKTQHEEDEIDETKDSNTPGFDSLKGLDPLVNWFVNIGRRFSPQANEFGFKSYPKGVILTGVPGCGKTMAAKVVASEWKMNFRRIEVNDVTSRYVGGNEQKMATILKELEAAAPVVCFVDEAEKLFAQVRTGDLYGAGDAGRDGTESLLLQFIEENESGVFFIFTSNDLDKMSPALVDRFDERFFIDLPTYSARLEMISSMLQERKKNPADYDLNALAKASDSFTGRNIRTAIEAAMMDAFGHDSKLEDIHLRKAFSDTTSTTQTHLEHINKIRKMVTSGKIRSANTVESTNTVQSEFDPSIG